MDISSLATALLLLVVAGMGAVFFTRRLDRIEARIDRLPTREEFDQLVGRVSRVETELTAIRSEMAAMRSDIVQIAIALGAQLRPHTG